MIKKIIGLLLIFAPFIGLFIFICKEEGVGMAILVFGTVAGFVCMAILGILLLK